MTRPFIVAELSASHGGMLERALQIVEAAASAGADAVKIQTWDTMVLDDSYVIEAGPWAGRRLVDLYAEAKTPWVWHEPIFRRCKELGMIGFSTPFDRASLEFLEALHCPIYKVASFEITDLELIRAIAATGKPVIISTGMASAEEIQDACNAACDDGGCVDLTLLKCTSAYPATAEDAHLRTMEGLMTFPRATAFGLSDHTPGIGVAVAAAVLGAAVIEKHLTLRRSDGGPDAAFSMEPEEFRQLVTECRRAEAALGVRQYYGPRASEMAQYALRRSLYVAKDIKAGEPITKLNVRTARPGKGLPPRLLPELLGRAVVRDVSRETPLTMDLIEKGIP